jgi:hypothetical protein
MQVLNQRLNFDDLQKTTGHGRSTVAAFKGGHRVSDGLEL